MSTRSMGITLIVIGALTMLFSRLMKVTVGDSGIVNINLLSEKQNTLIFGGLFFLAGIILYAVFKNKQTKEEEVAEELKSKEKGIALKSSIKNIFSSNETYTDGIKNKPFSIRSYSIDFSEGWKTISIKFAIGIYLGLMAATNFWIIVYEYFRSENVNAWSYANNSYYLILMLIILLAIKNGSIKRSLRLSLMVSMPIILSVIALRIYLVPADDIDIIILFTPLFFP